MAVREAPKSRRSTKAPKSHVTRFASPADYLKLVKRFRLRPIQTKDEYEAALAIMDEMAVRDEATLSRGEQDYLNGLATFIELHDESCVTEDDADSPLELLAALMENRGVTVSELGLLFGSKGVASEILSGKRSLTLKIIHKLAEYFRVSPKLFVSQSRQR